ncbi:MAG: rRNA maturation RNase YbeY [Pelagibacteraceae bacterium]
MIKVNVVIGDKNWKKYIKNPKQYLNKKIKKLNKNNIYFRKKKVEFSIMINGDSYIKQLNKKFRKKNKSTDVLSFPFNKKKSLNNLLNKNSLFYLGDIVINLSKILDKSNNKKLKQKFDRLWIHGFLHLLGNRHKLNKDYLKMKKLENTFFNSIN